ncbi:MAG: GeoRSP system SPASM domain protein, partial [Desulfuromonadales bacterium]
MHEVRKTMELASPITIYWDLPEGGEISTVVPIADEILACRPLMLQVTFPAPGLEGGAVAALERLQGSGIAVSVTIPLPASDELILSRLHGLGVKEVLLAVSGFAELIHHAGVIENDGLRPALGVSFTLARDHWRELPALIILCREMGITRFVIPMERLYDGRSPFLLTRDQQLELATALVAAGGTSDMSVTIHDPFIWRAFNPTVPFPQGGCQAANTMIAIASDGGVYPCPSLPVRLGDLAATPLKDIISSPAKKEFRRRLLAMPADCEGCGELGVCRG